MRQLPLLYLELMTIYSGSVTLLKIKSICQIIWVVLLFVCFCFCFAFVFLFVYFCFCFAFLPIMEILYKIPDLWHFWRNFKKIWQTLAFSCSCQFFCNLLYLLGIHLRVLESGHHSSSLNANLANASPIGTPVQSTKQWRKTSS